MYWPPIFTANVGTGSPGRGRLAATQIVNLSAARLSEGAGTARNELPRSPVHCVGKYTPIPLLQVSRLDAQRSDIGSPKLDDGVSFRAQLEIAPLRDPLGFRSMPIR